MSIPHTRFSTMGDDEFDIPTVTLDSPGTSGGSTDTNMSLGDIKATLPDLPAELGFDKEGTRKALEKIGKSAIDGKDIGSIMGQLGIDKLTPLLKKQNKELQRASKPSPFSNVAKPKTDGDPGCAFGLDELLGALNLKNTGSELGLLALINRLACAGINNAFTAVFNALGSSIDNDTAVKVGEILVKGKDPSKSAKQVVEILAGGYGDDIIKKNPDIGKDLLKSITESDTKNSNTNAPLSLQRDIDTLMNGIDSSNWGGNDYGAYANIPFKSKENFGALSSRAMHVDNDIVTAPIVPPFVSTSVKKHVGITKSNSNPLETLQSTMLSLF